MKRLLLAAMAPLVLASTATAQTADPPSGPTCSDFGLANHGEHIIGDYVSGLGGIFPPNELGWPPDGRDVGDALAGEGAVAPGAAGHFGHHDGGLAPGASFCTDGAQSWGVPRGGN